MTPKTAIDVNYFEPEERYSHQAHSQTRYQTDPDNEVSPQFEKIFIYFKKKLLNVTVFRTKNQQKSSSQFQTPETI